MIIEKIGSRGVYFTYEDGDSPLAGNTSIYLINADNKIFLCDTHLGPKSMEHVYKYINNNDLNDKEIIVFNSHADWDHIWGNSAFDGATIIGHEIRKKRIQEEGEYDLKRYTNKYNDGTIKLKLPNLTFNNKLKYEDDNIEFIYTPGHTLDSSICFDTKDSVVFVGDLLEYPVPFTNHYDVEAYLKTLEFIKSLSVKVILSAHSGIVNEKLFNDNLDYIRNLLQDKPIDMMDKDSMSCHNYNSKKILMSRYEYIVREKLAEKFNYESFKREFWDTLNINDKDLVNEHLHMMNTKYEDLEEALNKYISRL